LTAYGGAQAHLTVGDFDDFAKDGKTRPCPQLWQRLVILSNGEATVCWLDYEGDLGVGNIANNTIEELWNSDCIKEIRAFHFKKDFDKLPECESYMSISTTYQKLTMQTLLKLDVAMSADIDF
jgi:radical SAM protein with 4Fe4S-binding SPASM domain